MPDDLRERIAELRRLRDAASPLPWMCDIHRECSPDDDDDLWYATGPVHVRRYSGPASVEAARREALADMAYLQAAANIAPALADAYDAALATIAERDAEIRRLKEALTDIEQAGHNPADMMPDLVGLPDRYEILACRLAAIANDALKGSGDEMPTL